MSEFTMYSPLARFIKPRNGGNVTVNRGEVERGEDWADAACVTISGPGILEMDELQVLYHMVTDETEDEHPDISRVDRGIVQMVPAKPRQDREPLLLGLQDDDNYLEIREEENYLVLDIGCCEGHNEFWPISQEKAALLRDALSSALQNWPVLSADA